MIAHISHKKEDSQVAVFTQNELRNLHADANSDVLESELLHKGENLAGVTPAKPKKPKKVTKSKSMATFTLILCIFIISRVGVYTISYFGYNLFSKYTQAPQYMKDTAGYTRMVLPEIIAKTHFPSVKEFVQFDSPFYLRIAERGYDRYRMKQPHPAADWPFFPLYPLLIRLFDWILPLGRETVAILLSNIFGFVGIYFVYRIALECRKDSKIALNTIIYLLLYPASLYLSVIYTESLFIFLSALSVYLYMRKKVGWSILVASLSTVTRIPGIANLFFIALCLAREVKWDLRRIQLKYYGYLILSSLPLLTFFTYMYFLTGDFFAVFNELSDNWGRSTSFPFFAYIGYFFNPTFVQPGGWDLGLASFIFTYFVTAVYIAFFASRKWNYPYRFELAVYGFILILIPLSSASTTMTSLIRYYMASFPLFLYMADMSKKNRLLDFSFILLFLSFNVIYTISFINSYFFVV